MTENLVVAAIDVGSVRNIGWWRITGSNAGGGRDLDELVDLLVADLNAGRQVALGIEAPVYVPAPVATSGLGRARVGEGNRAWCASAGTSALGFGVQETNYVLRAIARHSGRPVRGGIDVDGFLAGALDLLVWEALVTAGSKDRLAPEPHIADARVAAEEFATRVATGRVESDLAGGEVFNLAAAAIIAVGMSTETSMMRAPCVVVRPPALA